MYKIIGLVVGACIVFAVYACTVRKGPKKEPPGVVPGVDINRYAGFWYEIARYPNNFQKDCFGSTATYSVREDGTIGVVNSCRKGAPDGPEKKVSGKAWVVDPDTHAKLKVRFFWPFSGNYWILQLDDSYRYAVVGNPSRTYLWILSRTPTLDTATYTAICEKLKAEGFDPDKLIRTPQQG